MYESAYAFVKNEESNVWQQNLATAYEIFESARSSDNNVHLRIKLKVME